MKNLILIPLTLASLTPSKTTSGFTYTRQLNQQYNMTNTASAYYESRGSYYSVGIEEGNNTLGGITYKNRIIQYFYIEQSGETTNLFIELFACTIISQAPTGITYTGNVTQHNTINVDPSIYDKATYGFVEVNETEGHDMNDIENEVFNNFTSLQGIYDQIDNSVDVITNEGNGWDGQIWTGTTGTAIYNNVISQINQPYKYWNIGYEDIEFPNNRYGFVEYVKLEKTYTGLLTNQQIDLYKKELDNYSDQYQWLIDYVGTPIAPTTEVIDLPGLMFTILGMPFAWISTAFNLTIFPGTPYAINIANIFMTIIGVLILIFIIKKVIK